MSGPRFAGLSVRLLSKDLEATLDFYTELLGFTIDVLWPEDAPTVCVLDNGPVHLLFYREGPEDETPGATAQLTIETEGVQDLYQDVLGRAEVLWGPEVYDYGRREFSIRDPNGYELIFSELTEDPPTSGDR